MKLFRFWFVYFFTGIVLLSSHSIALAAERANDEMLKLDFSNQEQTETNIIAATASSDDENNSQKSDQNSEVLHEKPAVSENEQQLENESTNEN
ncbi:MAG: hypothetical protein Q4C95_09315, partial [Planctomycetia bacterium]|nr:hypothetical protein [Planctomycetia bacterium]